MKPWLWAVISSVISLQAFAQSAASQLEQAAGRSLNSARIAAPSAPQSVNTYQQSMQQRQEQRAAEKRERSYQENRTGLNLMQQQEWKKAYKALKRAHRLNPYDDNIRINYERAKAAYERDKERRAEAKEEARQDRADAKRDAERQREREKAARAAEELREQQRKEAAEEAARLAREEQKMLAKQQQARLDSVYRANKKAEARIRELKVEIKTIQQQLGVYGQALRNNQADYAMWGDEVDKAYKRVISNTKDEIQDLFIKYGLKLAFSDKTKDLVFGKLQDVLASNSPAFQKWLLMECKLRKISPDKMQDLVDQIKAGKSAYDVYRAEEKGQGSTLNTLLMVNGIFESFNIGDYKDLQEAEKFFGADKVIIGDYMSKAKLIGETYTDLAAISWSWFEINRLTATDAEMAEQVSSLSNKMQYKMEQLKCLESCLKKYEEACARACVGATRFHTPPPPPF